MLGIPDYNPVFYENARDFIQAQKRHLCPLIGKAINRYFVQWEVSNEEWNSDGPIILEIDGIQHEFCAYQIGLYSLTVGQIDRKAKLNWYGAGDSLPLEWRANPFLHINQILNREIEAIYIIEYQVENVIQFPPLCGIEFLFRGLDKKLCLFNDLDCNGMKIRDYGEPEEENVSHIGLSCG